MSTSLGPSGTWKSARTLGRTSFTSRALTGSTRRASCTASTWEDYDDYPEYKGTQASTYASFLRNLEVSGLGKRVGVHRGYSHAIIPAFANSYFDLIYIDGNHEPEAVLEDASLSFRKLRTGGVLVFDDYGWGGKEHTQKGIDAFLSGYQKRVTILGQSGTQLFARKDR